jgi:glycogen synthase
VLAGSDFCIVPSRFEPCGLVDYEAAVLGNIPIIRKTGGLVKTLPYSYSYSWYDEDDSWGETFTLSRVLERAISEYLHYPALHQQRIQNLMQLDTSWDRAVEKYWRLFRL